MPLVGTLQLSERPHHSLVGDESFEQLLFDLREIYVGFNCHCAERQIKGNDFYNRGLVRAMFHTRRA